MHREKDTSPVLVHKLLCPIVSKCGIIEAMNTQEIKYKVSPVLRKYGIRHAAVFGSAARGTSRPESDIDLLIRLGKPMGMFLYVRLLRELERALGRSVDVVTDSSVNKFVKPYIIPELKTIYG